MRYLFLFLAMITLGACGDSGGNAARAEEPDSSKPNFVRKKVQDEDALFMKLSAELIADPAILAEEERNTIINYAIDNLLDVERSPFGIYYQIMEEGSGELLQWGDRVRIHYRGYFLDGELFDSTYGRGTPLEIYIGNMIQGWNDGLQKMKPGGKALFLIPSELGYGEAGFLDANGKILVPPNEILLWIETSSRSRTMDSTSRPT